ncbi:hypothetical protein MTR67_012692 [Solanum verrucosum]|uniref:Uncharacterized protein n=1 Tax=Solanum verrucosum TaxID=315347 RepID=A0AAF0QAA3_SOLVR|nr:hypothetical protein MTR67_012692 [Solanum verrucosum]
MGRRRKRVAHQWQAKPKEELELQREKQLELIHEISIEEIDAAIKDMPKDKSPGIDGYPIEFFTTHWGLVKEEPAEKWANFFDNNRMFAKGMNLSNINLVVKKGEKVIELNKDETDKETENWKQELILYVVGDSPILILLQLKGILHSRISSGLGASLYADECTTKMDRISYARVFVEMDVARELPKIQDGRVDTGNKDNVETNEEACSEEAKIWTQFRNMAQLAHMVIRGVEEMALEEKILN